MICWLPHLYICPVAVPRPKKQWLQKLPLVKSIHEHGSDKSLFFGSPSMPKLQVCFWTLVFVGIYKSRKPDPAKLVFTVVRSINPIPECLGCPIYNYAQMRPALCAIIRSMLSRPTLISHYPNSLDTGQLSHSCKVFPGLDGDRVRNYVRYLNLHQQMWRLLHPVCVLRFISKPSKRLTKLRQRFQLINSRYSKRQ